MTALMVICGRSGVNAIGYGHHRVPDRSGQPVTVTAIEIREAGLGQRPCDLPHPVGTEVQADDRVPGTDQGLVADQDRRDELIRLAPVIRRPGGGRPVAGAMLRATVDEHVVGELDAVPAAVAIHRVVAPDDRADAKAMGLPVDALKVDSEAALKVIEA